MAKVTVNEGSVFTDYVRLDYNDLIAIGNGGTRVIASIPAHGAVELVGVANTVDIAGSSTLVIDVGTTSADPDEFINALDVDAMTTPVFNQGDQFTAGTTVNTTGVSQPLKASASAQDFALSSRNAAATVPSSAR